MIDPADTATVCLPVTTDSPIRLRFASDDRTYVAVLEQDLLRDWVVVQSWGGKFTARGGGKIQVVSDREQGMTLLQNITRRRLQHGYSLLD